MNKKLVVLLLLGWMTHSQAIKVDSVPNSMSPNVQQVHLQLVQKKAAEAKAKSSATLEKIN
jgi:hypothetical protein